MCTCEQKWDGTSDKRATMWWIAREHFLSHERDNGVGFSKVKRDNVKMSFFRMHLIVQNGHRLSQRPSTVTNFFHNLKTYKRVFHACLHELETKGRCSNISVLRQQGTNIKALIKNWLCRRTQVPQPGKLGVGESKHRLALKLVISRKSLIE